MIYLYSLVLVVLKRLWHNLGLSIISMVGIVSILTIAICVPIFSTAVSSQVLKLQLVEKVASSQRRVFSLHVVYSENNDPPRLTIEKVDEVTRYLQGSLPRLVGIPVEQVVTTMQSPLLNVINQTGRKYEDFGAPLTRWRFIVQDLVPANLKIVDGRWPDANAPASGPIEVAVPDKMADEMFLEVGDHFQVDQFEVQIVGMFHVRGVLGTIWYNSPESDFSNTMWVSRAVYTTRVMPALNPPVGEIGWYVIGDEKALDFQRALQYSHGLVRMSAELRRMLPGINIDYSPMEALTAYQKRADTLTTLFSAVGSPMIVLALLFIALTARIAVQQYETETATMRGRGTSPGQILWMNLGESVLLVVLAFPFSLLTGWGAANVMGKTVSFLRFTDRPAFPFSFSGLNPWVIAITTLAIIVARFYPMLAMSRITILRVKAVQGRGSGRPFWERIFLDFILLIPGLYAFFIMRGWAKPAQFLVQMMESDNTFRDPLLFIAPALFAMAASMLLLRIIPLLVRIAAAVSYRLPGVWAYLSLQQISRRSQDHATVMLLIMISLALSIFSTSAAKTLDQWLYDSEHYKVGADLAVQEYTSSSSSAGGLSSGGSSSGSLMEGMLTNDEHLALPGIRTVTRIGRYDGVASYLVGEIPVTIMGIDRLDFPRAAFYREDFAKENLGTLMNALGLNLDGILIPTVAAEKVGLAIGDKITLSVSLGDTGYKRDMVVVGFYDYFPTIYPTNRPTVIANLDSLFENPEDVEGYEVWLNLTDGAVVDDVLKEIRSAIGSNQATVIVSGNSLKEIKLGQEKPERIGLFGVLNVGFLATSLMPGIGFLLYTFSSLRRRFIQLGILQALGLSVRQLVASLITEQLILMGLALLGGAASGLVTSLLFIPYLQVGVTPGTPIPPFNVLVGWAEAGWLSLGFGFILLITMLGTIIYLVRLKVFQAVKLGETV